jgi:hypothetical protein
MGAMGDVTMVLGTGIDHDGAALVDAWRRVERGDAVGARVLASRVGWGWRG